VCHLLPRTLITILSVHIGDMEHGGLDGVDIPL